MPKSPHLLLAATNVRRLHSNLADVLEPSALLAIETEIRANVGQLYTLGKSHFMFAKRQKNRDWRQKISRFYYCAYNVSRAVRLWEKGEYSTESGEHKKIEILPDGFPNKSTYANRLANLREDRNLCDYDHVARRTDLLWDVDDSAIIVEQFLRDARNYLIGHGANI